MTSEQWRKRAVGWRSAVIPSLAREAALQYAHQCELVADALEAGQLQPQLIGYPKLLLTTI